MQRTANHQDSKNFGSLGQKGVWGGRGFGEGRTVGERNCYVELSIRFGIICNEPGLLLQYFFFF